MLELYNQGRHVVNVDESWVPDTDFRRFCWKKRGETNSLPENGMSHKINMIVAVSTEGQVWLALTQCNTDESVMQMFLSKLAKAFTSQYGSSWRDEIVVVLDGASYHKSQETRTAINYLRIPVVLSSPYSY